MPLHDDEYSKLSDKDVAIKTMEECGELVQALGKLATNGPVAVSPDGSTYDNAFDVYVELEQVMAGAWEIAGRLGIDFGERLKSLRGRRNAQAKLDIETGKRTEVTSGPSN